MDMGNDNRRIRLKDPLRLHLNKYTQRENIHKRYTKEFTQKNNNQESKRDNLSCSSKMETLLLVVKTSNRCRIRKPIKFSTSLASIAICCSSFAFLSTLVVEPIVGAPGLLKEEANRNKISAVLNLIHERTARHAYRVDPAFQAANGHEQNSLHQLTDQEMLKKLCPTRITILCESLIDRAHNKDSPGLQRLVFAIKNRPEGTNPQKVALHKLYEEGAEKIMEKKVDKVLDFGVNNVIRRTPYGYASVALLGAISSRNQ